MRERLEETDPATVEEIGLGKQQAVQLYMLHKILHNHTNPGIIVSREDLSTWYSAGTSSGGRI